MTANDRILICGVGSIGERHIRNLFTLGYEQLAVYRARGLPLRSLDRELLVYTDLDQALAHFAPTVAFVTNPTALHFSTSLAAARAGCHLFIEKPVSYTLDGLSELQSVLDTSGQFAMVGYMLRFHPLLQQVKSWIEQGPNGRLGRPLFTRSTWGEHLPDWHPWEDYRNSYAGSAALGGGPALTLSHDIDLLVWMFGRATQVATMTSTATPLEIDCEHVVDLLARFENGVIANIHLDYCQCPPRREWELVGTRGRVLFDYYGGRLTYWPGVVGELPPPDESRRQHPEVVYLSDDFDRNDLFLEELRYFFSCLSDGRAPMPGINEAAESVRIANAISKGNQS